MKTDLEIAQAHQLKRIEKVADELGIEESELEPYGKTKGKIQLSALHRLKDRPIGKYIVVTAVTPTPLGEGKTLTTIGLTQSLGAIGKRAMCTLREPSMGPLFGIKGGAAGGGYSQVVPMEDINLHFTGDIPAVGEAHNLLAAMLDASLHHGNPWRLDPRRIVWPRCVDFNDRALRQAVVGLGGRNNGLPRETNWVITVASEVMAILALASDFQDLRRRMGRIIVGYTHDREPVTAEQLKAAGAMTVLLKDAIKPNLVQTLEGQPALIHAGPFANIAHGNNSVVADQMAVRLADYVVTESGFGADCGAEKMMNIKCRASGLTPDCVVLTATVRSIKMHGGAFTARPGKAIDETAMKADNLPAVVEGCQNLVKHIENMRKFGLPVVVAINRFDFDRDTEIDIIKKIAVDHGAQAAVAHTCHADGGAGGTALAEAVAQACESKKSFKFLYDLDAPIAEKIETIATEIYGAEAVDFGPDAKRMMRRFQKDEHLSKLPICMAKTQYSLSHDPKLLNAPKGFRLPVRDIIPSAGAGFLYPLCGEMMTMPGLPSKPTAHQIDIDEDGNPVGLF